jgi:GxxExxY protein
VTTSFYSKAKSSKLSAAQSRFSTHLVTGLIEKPYENALVVEFGLRLVPFRQQPSFDVVYKGQEVGLFIPDLIAFDTIVVDTKVIDRITDHERGLMLNYLRIARLHIGVILNFQHPKLECSGLSCSFVFIRVYSWLTNLK